MTTLPTAAGSLVSARLAGPRCLRAGPAGGTGGRKGLGKEQDPMATTAWQFSGTEGADNAVLTLTRLQDQELIDVQDVAVIRWPMYAAAPMTQEHVTEQ